VGEHVGELAIVGKQYQTRGIYIQSPNRIQVGLYLRNQLQNSMLCEPVESSTGIAYGLVEKDVKLTLLRLDRLSVDCNYVFFRVCLISQFCYSPVDCNPTGSD